MYMLIKINFISNKTRFGIIVKKNNIKTEKITKLTLLISHRF